MHHVSQTVKIEKAWANFDHTRNLPMRTFEIDLVFPVWIPNDQIVPKLRKLFAAPWRVCQGFFVFNDVRRKPIRNLLLVKLSLFQAIALFILDLRSAWLLEDRRFWCLPLRDLAVRAVYNIERAVFRSSLQINCCDAFGSNERKTSHLVH